MKPKPAFRPSAFCLLPSAFCLFFRRWWIVLGVVGAHLLFFWAVSDKHFLPRAPAYIPPPTPPNFGGATRRTVDPRTGETVTETQFVVSTTFATPASKPAASASASSQSTPRPARP